MKELDFLPASIHEARRRRKVRQRNTLYAIGLAMGLGCLHFVNASRLQTAEATLAAIHRGDRVRSLQRSQLQVLRNRKHVLASQLELLNRLDDDAPLDAVAAQITRHMPDSMVLGSLAVETSPVDDSASEAADPLLDRGPTRVSLHGLAQTDMAVGYFVGRLSECALFADVELIFSREAKTIAGPAREFELALTVNRVVIE